MAVKKPAAKAAPVTTTRPRAVTLPTLKKDERWGGIVLNKKGKPDYHLIGLPGSSKGTHDEMLKWAKEQGGDLPDHRDGHLAQVNLRDLFEDAAYWLKDKHASDSGYAYCQYFTSGDQGYDTTNYSLRARAVRRVKI